MANTLQTTTSPDGAVATRKKNVQVGSYWRENVAIAWNETELLSRSKILTTLGISIIAFLLQWVDSVRTLAVTLQIIGTVVMAYLLVAIVSFLWKLMAHVPAARQSAVELDNKKMHALLRPQLRIIFKPKTTPFEQIYAGVTQYRVVVVSPTAIPDAELLANFVGPQCESGIHLRERHDRNEARRVGLKVFRAGVWDVVSAIPKPEGGISVVLNHITEIEQIVFPIGLHEFELMASGGDNPPQTKLVSLNVKADSLEFKVSEGRLSESYTDVEEETA